MSWVGTATGWPLDGKHAQVSCAKCHDQRTASATPTYLGKKTACAGCHDDPHAGRGLIGQLQARGYRPVPVDMSELRKAGGGPKCCTLELRS